MNDDNDDITAPAEKWGGRLGIIGGIAGGLAAAITCSPMLIDLLAPGVGTGGAIAITVLIDGIGIIGVSPFAGYLVGKGVVATIGTCGFLTAACAVNCCSETCGDFIETVGGFIRIIKPHSERQPLVAGERDGESYNTSSLSGDIVVTMLPPDDTATLNQEYCCSRLFSGIYSFFSSRQEENQQTVQIEDEYTLGGSSDSFDPNL